MGNVIKFTWEMRETSSFQKKIYPWYFPAWVISLEDEKTWRELQTIEIEEERDSIAKNIIQALKGKRNTQDSAEIIPFPNQKSA